MILEAWMIVNLCLWSAGVQTFEALGTTGMIGLGLGAIWHMRMAGRLDARRTLLRWWPLAAFLVWAMAAPAVAGRLPTASGVARLMDWLGLPLAAYAVAVLPPRRLRVVGLVVAAVMLASIATGCLQHFGIWPAEDTFRSLGWTRIPFGRVYETIPGRSDRFMAGGLLFHRLKFAHVTGLGALWILAYGFEETGHKRAIALLVALGSLLAVLGLAYARAAAAALIAAILLALWLDKKRRLGAMATGLGAVLLVGGLVALNAPLRERFASAIEQSEERRSLWASGLAAIRLHPLVGVGAGNFRPALFAPAGAPASVLEHHGKAHSQALSLAAETGLVGLALFLLVLVRAARRLDLSSPAGRAGIASLVFFALLSLTHDPLFHEPFSQALVLALGAALGLSAGQYPAGAASRGSST